MRAGLVQNDQARPVLGAARSARGAVRRAFEADRLGTDEGATNDAAPVRTSSGHSGTEEGARLAANWNELPGSHSAAPLATSGGGFPPLKRPGSAGGSGAGRRRRSVLAGLEWVFLLVGLLAVDCYVWVNTAATLDQAYSDWAFDQTLRGLKPSLRGFVNDEVGWLFHEKGTITPTPQENAEKAQPFPPSAPAPRPGELIGRLRIPRLDVAVMVREGAGESTLRRAVGHIPGTGLPGQIGNVALAGHRDTFFRPLRNIRKDDVIDLETGRGTLHYLVQSTQIVSPSDVGVLKASAGKTLTLVTCYPFYYVGSAPKRFIVRAVEVGSGGGPAALMASGGAAGSSKGGAYKRVASNHRPRRRPGS
jgi:sortase A